MAVYTDVTDDDLTAFMAEYDLGSVIACKGIAEGVENSNFLLQTERGNYILTLYEKRVLPADLPFFLGLMDHLARGGFRCPTPVPGRDGQVLRQLCGRPAAIVTFLEGLWPRHIQNFHCAELGRILAALHRAGRDFPMTRPNSLSLDGWAQISARVHDRADEVETGLSGLIAAELEYLGAAWPRALPTGIVHADLFPDNVFFRDQEASGVIDFYFACTDFLSYDLAICLNAWCFDEEHRFRPDLSQALVTSYREARPLTDAECAMLPVLARGAALRFLLTRLYDWLYPQGGALVRPKDPREYLAKLRFHQDAGGAASYGC